MERPHGDLIASNNTLPDANPNVSINSDVFIYSNLLWVIHIRSCLIRSCRPVVLEAQVERVYITCFAVWSSLPRVLNWFWGIGKDMGRKGRQMKLSYPHRPVPFHASSLEKLTLLHYKFQNSSEWKHCSRSQGIRWEVCPTVLTSPRFAFVGQSPWMPGRLGCKKRDVCVVVLMLWNNLTEKALYIIYRKRSGKHSLCSPPELSASAKNPAGCKRERREERQGCSINPPLRQLVFFFFNFFLPSPSFLHV